MGKYDAMLEYIEETPQKLAENVDNRLSITGPLVSAYLEKQPRSIWLIACGSSSNASRCALPFMRKYLNREVEVVNPASFLYSDYTPTADTFCLVISQSGCSTNSIQALDKLHSLGFKAIGITGNLDSDFKEHADLLVDYGVGEEKVGYVTKGVATLTEFLMLFAVESAYANKILNKASYSPLIDQFKMVPNLHEKVQETTLKFYEDHYKDLTSIRVNYVCGFDQAYGIACEAALKFGETIKVPSFAFEAEEFNHGPNLQLTPNYTVFFIDDLNLGHHRLVQLWKATTLITDHAFLLTTDHSTTVGNNVFNMPNACPNESLLEPLYLLPFFQIIAFKATNDLKRWDSHPLFKKFRKAAPSKTETISKIMPI